LADYENGRADERETRRPEPAEERPAPSGERGRGPGGRGGPRRDMRRRARVCQFCVEKAKVIDYKDVGLLRQFVTDGGRMLSRRKTGTCAKHQRMIARAIKRARHMAFLPYTAEHARFASPRE